MSTGQVEFHSVGRKVEIEAVPDHGTASNVRRGPLYNNWNKSTNFLDLLRNNPVSAIMYDLGYQDNQNLSEGRIPVFTQWAQHGFMFPRVLPPVLLQWGSMKLGFPWPTSVAYVIYVMYFCVLARMITVFMRERVQEWGYLDGNAKRDNIPEASMTGTLAVLVGGIVLRPFLGFFLLYDPLEIPRLSIWLPIDCFMYTTILDFYFYTSHRAMHEIDFLWTFHEKHHMAKHPTIAFLGFIDWAESFASVFLVPLLTVLTYRVDFHTYWICTMYVVWIEVLGHSGIRAFAATTGYPVLKYFDMDLIAEDHDLHHRYGVRKSFNYGKQTRVWDKLFGTTRRRVQCVPENIE